MTLQEIESAVNQEGFSVVDCVRQTGLHPNTIYRIKQKRAQKLNPLTQEAIEKYLKKQAK